MSLTAKWWLTPSGAAPMDASEHAVLSLRYLLNIPIERAVPMWWTMRGVPEQELADALARGADPKAIEFLSKKGNDSRLWVLREMGWIRTAKSAFNLWSWDKKTVSTIRNATDYWRAQNLTGHEMIDVEEFDSKQTFTISVAALLDGGDPTVLKNLALGYTDLPEEVVAPTYSTAKWTETERRALAGRTGDNPPETGNWEFVTNCIGSRGDWIRDMADQEKDISRATFLKYVNRDRLEQFERELGYDTGHERGGLRMVNDWAVSYHKSEYRGVPCVFFRHSRIEYIFCPRNSDFGPDGEYCEKENPRRRSR